MSLLQRAATVHSGVGCVRMVVKGRATLEGDTLRWQVLETVKAGEPEWEPGLVLGTGILGRTLGSVGSE